MIVTSRTSMPSPRTSWPCRASWCGGMASKFSKSQSWYRRGMRAACRKSSIPAGRPRGTARHAHGRARDTPAASRMRNPVPPQRSHSPVVDSLIDGTRAPERSVQITLQLLALLRAIQLLQRLGLDLADALARQPHHLADFLERLGLSFVQTESQPQHLLLLRVELSQTGVQMVLERGSQQGHDGRRDHVLLELVRKVELVLLVDHRGQRDILVGHLQQTGDLLHRDPQLPGDLLRGGGALEAERHPR